MRTQDEIVERIEERKEMDMFGFETDEYMAFLDWSHVKPYLDDSAKEEEWGSIVKPDRETVLDEMKEYMPFANEKADHERGLSAIRSIMHFVAWIWFLGDDEFLAKVESEFDKYYDDYGKSILRSIEKHYGWSKDT